MRSFHMLWVGEAEYIHCIHEMLIQEISLQNSKGVLFQNIHHLVFQ